MGLRLKLLLPILLALVTFSSALHLYWLPKYLAHEHEALTSQAQADLELLSTSLMAPMISGDLAQLYNTLNAILQRRPEWTSLVLHNPEGQRLYPLSIAPRPIGAGKSVLTQDIGYLETLVGRLSLTLDVPRLLAPRVKHIYRLEMGLMGLLLTVSLVGLYIQDRLVRRPLIVLGNAADRLGRGDFEAPLPAVSHDEVGKLTARFDVMRRTVCESQQRLQAVLDNVGDAIITLHDCGQIESYSMAAEHIFGYTPDEVIGHPVSLLLPSVSRSRHQLYDQGSLNTGPAKRIGSKCESAAQRKNGERLPIELSTSEITLGEVHFCTVAVRDISERKRFEAEREAFYQQLVQVSRQAGMAEVATGVLHNVGNVLNSVNAAAALALEQVSQSQVDGLAKAVALMDAHVDDLGTFITHDKRGQHLPTFLRQLAQHLLDERETTLEHLQAVTDKVEHIKEIVAMQQSYATVGGAIEPLALATLMDDALKTNDASFHKYEVEVVREYAELPLILTDRHKVLQVLVNLVGNAKHALLAADTAPKQLTVRIGARGADWVHLEVADNGVGIAVSDLTRIFQHGFTTKAEGHGFGLHSSALAAQELGGSLTVHSDGLGQGAVFRLELPMKEVVLCTV